MGVTRTKGTIKMQAEMDSRIVERNGIKKIISECSKSEKYTFLIAN
jgi:hypothetical protein